MEKGPIYAVIKNRKITLFIVALSVIFGFYSYYITPKQEAPDLTAPVAIINTVYPGASPEDVEKLVTRKIEDEIVEVDGYDYSMSYSNNSISTVVVRLEYGTNIEASWTELRQKIEDLQSQLPDEIFKPQINTNLVDTAGIILSISGDSYSYEELTSYAEEFKDKLSKINGIARFDIDGEQIEEVIVDVDAEKLNYYRMSLEDIVKIIASQNLEIPAGSIGEEKNKINVKTSGTFSSIKEIEDIILDISSENGSVVRLGHIAHVKILFKESNFRMEQNGKNAVLLTGYFKQDKNIVIIGNEVEKQLDSLKSSLPSDISVDEVLFQPKNVSKSVNDFAISLIEGILFVVIVVFIGMGIRNAIIVSTAIPISILATFIAMNVLGIKIHQISIAALIVALGMLVDNAIVISDSIQNRIDNGEDKMRACIEGVRDMAIPVFTSTLTTIAAFMPLLLLSSIAGEYISSLPMIVMISLASSYLVALFVTPTMAYIFFKERKEKSRVYKTREFFNRLLVKGMKRKKTVLLILILAIGGTILLVGQLGLQFFPKADKDIIYIDLKTERNTSIGNTQELVNEVSEILEEQPEIISYTTAIGNGLPKFYNTMPITINSPDVAQIMIKLDLNNSNRFKDNSQITDFLQERFNAQITGGVVTVKQLEIAEPIGSPIRVRVTGDNIERLGEVSKNIRNTLTDINGTINVDDDFNDRVYEFYIDIDTDKSSYYGLSKYDIQKEVSIALRGREASVFRRHGKEWDIILKSNLKTKEDLENLAIKSSYTGNKVLLKEIANVKLSSQIPTITKYDRDLAVMVTSDVKSGFSPVKIQEELTSKLKDMDIEDIEITFDGEKEKIAENFGSIGSSAIFAVLLIYAILLFQFKSFLQPLIILITIPLSGIGSILGLFMFNQPLSFTGLLGIVSLIGIVVNNAIVLIDYINSERGKGKSISDACLEATEKRFRPIMLSTITTVIGLTPLVFSGSEMFKPMAISLMSGLIIATLLTLIVIPVVYSMVEGKSHQFMKNRSGRIEEK